MNTAGLFIRCLESEGVGYIFGVPGEENAHFMMSPANSDIEFVRARHEQGATLMADVYGRLTGKLSVSLGTLSPGVTNLVTGVADANEIGWPDTGVEGSKDLKAALDDAMARTDQPTVTALPVDYRENQLLSQRSGQIACPI